MIVSFLGSVFKSHSISSISISDRRAHEVDLPNPNPDILAQYEIALVVAFFIKIPHLGANFVLQKYILRYACYFTHKPAKFRRSYLTNRFGYLRNLKRLYTVYNRVDDHYT